MRSDASISAILRCMKHSLVKQNYLLSSSLKQVSEKQILSAGNLACQPQRQLLQPHYQQCEWLQTAEELHKLTPNIALLKI